MKKKNKTAMELREIKPHVFRIFKNGKAYGKKYLFDKVNHDQFNFNDELLDIPCNALPDNTSFEFYFDPNTIQGWTSIITVTRRKNKLIISYFALFDIDGGNYYYNLNEYVLMRKICDAAKKHGMKPDYVSEEEPCTTYIYMISNTHGAIRQKISKGMNILSKIKKKAESELVADIRKGILFSKLNDIKFEGWLKLPS